MKNDENPDKLNFIHDKLIKAITRDEKFILSDKVYKKNHYGFYQERNIVITNKAIYNLKKKSLKRRIEIKIIQAITVSKISDEFIIHCINDEYDYLFYSSSKKEIIDVIAKYYKIETNKEILIYELSEKSLTKYVTTKK